MAACWFLTKPTSGRWKHYLFVFRLQPEPFLQNLNIDVRITLARGEFAKLVEYI